MTRMQLIAPNYVSDADHLVAVRDKMRALGPPTVRVVSLTGAAMETAIAIEGSHRIAAALSLELPIWFDWPSPNAVISDHDVVGFDRKVMGPRRACDLAQHIIEHCNYVIYVLN